MDRENIRFLKGAPALMSDVVSNCRVCIQTVGIVGEGKPSVNHVLFNFKLGANSMICLNMSIPTTGSTLGVLIVEWKDYELSRNAITWFDLKVYPRACVDDFVRAITDQRLQFFIFQKVEGDPRGCRHWAITAVRAFARSGLLTADVDFDGLNRMLQTRWHGDRPGRTTPMGLEVPFPGLFPGRTATLISIDELATILSKASEASLITLWNVLRKARETGWDQQPPPFTYRTLWNMAHSANPFEDERPGWEARQAVVLDEEWHRKSDVLDRLAESARLKGYTLAPRLLREAPDHVEYEDRLTWLLAAIIDLSGPI